MLLFANVIHWIIELNSLQLDNIKLTFLCIQNAIRFAFRTVATNYSILQFSIIVEYFNFSMFSIYNSNILLYLIKSVFYSNSNHNWPFREKFNRAKIYHALMQLICLFNVKFILWIIISSYLIFIYHLIPTSFHSNFQ